MEILEFVLLASNVVLIAAAFVVIFNEYQTISRAFRRWRGEEEDR